MSTLFVAAQRSRPGIRPAPSWGSEGMPPPAMSSAPARSRWFPTRKNEPLGALPSLRGRTILVVDDDPDALELMHMILEACGARVLAASNTTHARGYLLTATPDLILCDLAMPREDGPSFIHSVRSSNEALARVPAIAVTAFYEDYPPRSAAEFAAYFQKPIDIDSLTRTVASLLAPPQR